MNVLYMNFRRLGVLIILSVLSVIVSPNIAASDTPASVEADQLDYQALNRLHQAFSSNFHRALLKKNNARIGTFKSIKSLNRAVKDLYNNDQPLLAANLIIKHIPLLKNNYDNFAILNFIDILLEQNERSSAVLLFDLIKQEGDSTLISNASYIFAKHAFKRHHWSETLNYLSGNINDLPHEDYHHALLIKGISLQEQKKHRSAIASYKKISKESKYYVSARLNMAIANIRQGWWTDAHILIEDVIKRVAAKRQEEPLNRLYLTLGYSLFNQEYYRDARDTFRNIGQQSQYVNRALIGLALTAASQEDYVGALNAIRILKQKQIYDLPVDEAYLLMPFFYEKLHQYTTATSGYNEAITHFQKRISELKKIMESGIDISRQKIHKGNYISMTINHNPVNFSTHYPDYILENYTQLAQYAPHLSRINDNNLTNKFDNLNSQYQSVIKQMVISIISRRIEHLNSYMDQSRYGLARLYDNNLVSKK